MARATAETGFSSWPSARTEDGESCGNHPGAVDSLTGAVRQWQAPATDSFRSRGGDRKDEQGLDQEARNWPTPFGFQAGNGPDGNEFSKEVRRVVNTWPTATKEDGESSARHTTDPSKPMHPGTTLTDAARQWPTPDAGLANLDEDPAKWAARKKLHAEKEEGATRAGMPLGIASQLWATPRTRGRVGDSCSETRALEGENVGLNDQAANWPTPMNHNDRGGPSKTALEKGAGADLNDAATAWPTPAARDYRTPNSQESEERRFSGVMKGKGQQLQNFVEHSPSSPLVRVTCVSGEELSPTDPSVASRRRLNPAFVCWLMGWPWWWTNPARNSFARAATGSYLFKLRSRLAYLLARYERLSASGSKVSRQSY